LSPNQIDESGNRIAYFLPNQRKITLKMSKSRKHIPRTSRLIRASHRFAEGCFHQTSNASETGSTVVFAPKWSTLPL